jgi:hypothetical protein
MFCGVVTMFDAGIVDGVVAVEVEAVVSLELSVVFCSLLLQDANENNTAPNKDAYMVRAEIIVVVLKI